MKNIKKFLIFILVIVTTISIIPPSDVAAATKLSRMSAKQIVSTLKDNGFPIDSYTIYKTNSSDPNHLIGKPHAYKYKIDFWDANYRNGYDEYSCTVEVFKNTSDASKRKSYIKSIYDSFPNVSSRMYQYSNVLLRIEYSVPKKRADYYKKAFASMSKGKTPKFPLSFKNKNVTLRKGKTTTLSLNVPSKKAKWSSTNKKIVTVSKTGKITAKKAGTATIIAKYNGYTAKCKVKVPAPQTVDDMLRIVRSDVDIQTNGLYFVNQDEFEDSDFVSFYITNNSSKDLVIGNTLKIYDDDYKYIGSLPFDDIFENTIYAGDSEIVGFEDDTLEESLLYLGQRLVFTIKVGGKVIYCYAEYTYNDNEPYSFSFHKSLP